MSFGWCPPLWHLCHLCTLPLVLAWQWAKQQVTKPSHSLPYTDDSGSADLLHNAQLILVWWQKIKHMHLLHPFACTSTCVASLATCAVSSSSELQGIASSFWPSILQARSKLLVVMTTYSVAKSWSSMWSFGTGKGHSTGSIGGRSYAPAQKSWAVLTGLGSIAFAYEFSVVLLEIQVRRQYHNVLFQHQFVWQIQYMKLLGFIWLFSLLCFQ